MKAKQWIRHEKYDQTGLHNDVGIIQLPMNAPFDKNLMPAYVYPIDPTDSVIFEKHFAQKTAKKAGWGQIGFQTQSLGDLRHTEVSVMSRADCKKEYPEINDNQFCTRTASANRVQVTKKLSSRTQRNILFTWYLTLTHKTSSYLSALRFLKALQRK